MIPSGGKSVVFRTPRDPSDDIVLCLLGELGILNPPLAAEAERSITVTDLTAFDQRALAAGLPRPVDMDAAVVEPASLMPVFSSIISRDRARESTSGIVGIRGLVGLLNGVVGDKGSGLNDFGTGDVAGVTQFSMSMVSGRFDP